MADGGQRYYETIGKRIEKILEPHEDLVPYCSTLVKSNQASMNRNFTPYIDVVRISPNSDSKLSRRTLFKGEVQIPSPTEIWTQGTKLRMRIDDLIPDEDPFSNFLIFTFSLPSNYNSTTFRKRTKGGFFLKYQKPTPQGILPGIYSNPFFSGDSNSYEQDATLIAFRKNVLELMENQIGNSKASVKRSNPVIYIN